MSANPYAIGGTFISKNYDYNNMLLSNIDKIEEDNNENLYINKDYENDF